MPDDPYDLPIPASEEADFGEAVIALLRGRRLTTDELVDALYADGWDLAENPYDDVLEVLDDDELPFIPIGDRWSYLPALLEGRTFTHRVTEGEVEHDLLAAAPDLEPIDYLREHDNYARLTTGQELELVFPDGQDASRRPHPETVAEFGSLLLPVGTLTGLGIGAGELVGLRYGPDGIEVAAVPAPNGPVDALRAQVLNLLTGSEPVEEVDLMFSLLADDPNAFVEPLPPISELLDSWPVERHLDWVAEQGFDWDRWRAGRITAPLLARWELSDEEAAAVATVLAYVRSTSDELTDETIEAQLDDTTPPPRPEPERLATALDVLHDPYVARVVLEECQSADPIGSGPGLVAAAEDLVALAPRRSRAALHWLWARGLERVGDLAGHEEHLRAAERLDPDCTPALADLARLAGDRGDAATALALLNRVPPQIATLLRSTATEYAPAPARMMPRNQPCWCGSGRKFKACHLRQTGARPLAERAGWLYQKAAVFAIECGWLGRLEALTEVRAAYIQSETLARESADDGLTIDVTLFEDGAFDAFVQTRGALLPADELLLAQQWLLADRSVYEVTEVNDHTITFRDLRTGDVLHAVDRLASRDLTSGMFVCSHLLPLPHGGHAIYSIDPVSLPQRTELLEMLDADDPDPVLLVAYLSRHLAPPTMVNTEGHPLAICEVKLETSEPVGLRAALDEAYGAAEAGTAGQTWIDHVLVDGEEKIRGTFALVGDELTLNTNSVERRDLMLAALRALTPDLTETSRLVTPAAELRARAAALSQDQADVGPFGQPLEAAPEIQAFMAEHMRGYEEKWLDLDIPALDGLTPRQAAADPTRRDDLLRLLATFPETDDPTQMSPGRLRSALGW